MDKCAYLNDIKECEITTVYECGDFIEIVYVKNGVQKSLVIEQNRYGGSMGYGSFFSFSGAELPQMVLKDVRLGIKSPFEQLKDIKTVIEINRYFYNANGYGDSEQLEIVYKDESDIIHSYLLGGIDSDGLWLVDTVQKDKKATFTKKECDETSLPTELFSVAEYKEVFSFALQAHKGQKTPEGLPYSFHIVSVATEIINSLSQHDISYDDANVAIACALLHDVQEDTETTIGTKSLDIPNINTVLQGVWALTKDEKLPTKQEQMQDSLGRLKQQSKCVQMVKLADRITNLAPAPRFWNKAKRKAYVDEARMILDALKDSNPYLANKLQNKIDSYEIEKDDNYLIFYGRTGEDNTEKIQLILDKSHPKYLQTFKALNRLNDYVFEQYNIGLFRQRIEHETYCNMTTQNGLQEHQKVGVNYIMKTLNSEDLLDLNKQTDEKIDKYFTDVLDGEGCIV